MAAPGRPPGYTFHFTIEPLGSPYALTCSRLFQALVDRARLQGTLQDDPPPVEYKPAWVRDPDLDADADDALPPLEPRARPFAPEALPQKEAPDEGAPFQPGDPADLADGSLWMAVSRLQWALRSDRSVTARGVAELVADLRSDGVLDSVVLAFRRLAGALVAAHPALAGVGRGMLTQLVALGHEMAIATAASPDLLAFVKNELQLVNLAALLRV